MKNAVPKTSVVLFIFFSAVGIAGCASKPTLETFRTDGAPCYDRSLQPQTSIVDAHLHFRPFGGPVLPFEEVSSYLEKTGVLFVNMYGIGQMLPVSSPCTYDLDRSCTSVTPTLKNDSPMPPTT